MDEYHIQIEREDVLDIGNEILDNYEKGILNIPNPVVVFDIDDTLIDSQSRNVIHPMKTLYNRILSIGIPIVLITARPPIHRLSTIRELSHNDIQGYSDLIFVDNHGNKGQRKGNERQNIENAGYNIFLNIGDDMDDMRYGSYLYGLKLPYRYD